MAYSLHAAAGFLAKAHLGLCRSAICQHTLHRRAITVASGSTPHAVCTSRVLPERARDANRKSQTTQSQQSRGARSSPGKHPTFAECRHQLLAEWDHTRNAAEGNYPHNINVKSIKKIHWLCGHCPAGQEHSWSAPPNDRTSRYKPGCPFCAGKAACRCNSLQALFPDMASEWDHSRNKRRPDDFPACSTDSAWWVNAKRGNWKQTIQSRTIVVQQSARPKRGQRHMPASPSQ